MKQHEHVCITLPPPHPNKRQQVHLIKLITKYYNNVIHLLVGGVDAVVDAVELVLGQGLLESS